MGGMHNLGKITQQELDIIMAEHKLWLESDMKSGRQAKLQSLNLSDAAMPDAFKKHIGYMAYVSLGGCNLYAVKLDGAKLRGASFVNANLSNASLQRGDLVNSNMEGANLQYADLRYSNLSTARMNNTILYNAKMMGVNLRHASLERSAIGGVLYNSKIVCRGVRLDGCYGHPRFERFLRDQDYLEELKESSRWGNFIYSLWKIFADCGRSIWPWALWSLIFVSWFGLQYFFLGPEHFKSDPMPWDWETAGYFSIVTFTTLGFGDVVPKSHWAARLVMAEVVAGYVMLGGLISIFASKIARRS